MSKINITLDASQIYEFQTCPLKWLYHYRENLQLAELTQEAMNKGTLIHQLCDLYYTLRWASPNGNKLLQANEAISEFKRLETTKAMFATLDEIEMRKLEAFLCERFMQYVNRYFNDDFALPQTRESPVELGFSKLLYEDQFVRYIVEGRIDLINVILGDKLVFTDHKTQSRSETLYSYKPQFKTYAWATGFEYGMVNYIGLQDDKNGAILKSGKMFRRQLIQFPKWMIQEWEFKMRNVFDQIYQLTVSMMNHKEFSEDKYIEQRIYSFRNDSACAGAFDSNPCQFTSICEEGNWSMKQGIKEFKYKKKEPWSPWRLQPLKELK